MEPPVDPFVPHTIPPASDFPFTINVRDLFPDLGDDDQITVTSVREISSSEGPEEPTIIINDDGTITYGPTGTFLRNSLINAQAMEITGRDTPEAAWRFIQRLIPLRLLDDYPEIAAALPDEAPLNDLAYMVTKLNLAKSSIYGALGFDEETINELLRTLNIE